MLDDAVTRAEQPGDYVDFHATGAAVDGAFRCSSCGYGVTVQARLPRCPMCGGTSWEAVASRPPQPDRQLL
jgi:rubredoxin